MERSLKRGDIVIGPPGGPYGSKPRPVVVVQDETLKGLHSVVVCLITSIIQEPGPFRLPVDATVSNGLVTNSIVMIDKVAAMPLDSIAKVSGRLSDDDLGRVDESLALLLGLAAR